MIGWFAIAAAQSVVELDRIQRERHDCLVPDETPERVGAPWPEQVYEAIDRMAQDFARRMDAAILRDLSTAKVRVPHHTVPFDGELAIIEPEDQIRT